MWETNRSWWDRYWDHAKAMERNDEKYAIVKHQANFHPQEPPNFIYKQHRTWKSSLERQVGEAIMINETKPGSLMNSKSEWGHNSIPRISVIRDNQEEAKSPNQSPTDPPTNQCPNGKKRRPNNLLQTESDTQTSAGTPRMTKKARYQMEDFYTRSSYSKNQSNSTLKDTTMTPKNGPHMQQSMKELNELKHGHTQKLQSKSQNDPGLLMSRGNKP